MPKKNIEDSQKEKKAHLETDLYDLKGTVVGKITLNNRIFGVEVSPALLAQTVRVYLANQRSGTHQAKTRGEVVGSTRKIYRQKGTGRARHGSLKAPIFIGGGVAHGPRVRDYSLSLPKLMRKKALLGALSQQYQSANLVVVDGLKSLAIKTKELNLVLKNLKLADESKKTGQILLITDLNDKNLYLSGRNIENLTIREVKNINTYEVLRSQKLVFMKESLARLQELFLSEKVKAEKVKLKPEKKKTKTALVKKVKKAVKSKTVGTKKIKK